MSTASCWESYADRVIAGGTLTRDEARDTLTCPDGELLALLQAAFKVRTHFHGRKVQIHVLENAKMGGCSEDCSFCSQSSHFDTGVPNDKLETVEELLEGARRAKAAGAYRYCMVTATRGPSEKLVDVICEAAERIKGEMNISLCASLGFLDEKKASRLADAGIDRFNHNLETSKRHFPSVVTTHTFDDRVSTVRLAKAAGMETCCGGIMGLGEQMEDLIDMGFYFKELDVDSCPINFLNARPGTPLEGTPSLDPKFCLKALAMYRFLLPRADLRAAGGREVVLRSLQPLALYAANSIFTQGYLTTDGADSSADHQMIRDLGLEIEVVGVEGGAEHESCIPAGASA